MKNHRESRLAAVSLLCALSVQAAVINIPVSEEAFILSDWADNNAGAHSHTAVGTTDTLAHRRGLFRFDLSAIPASSIINSASVQMTVVGTSRGAISAPFSLHLLTATWGAGSGTGNIGTVALAGEATWNSA